MRVTYTASRGVINGHSIGNSYSLDIPIKSHNPSDVFDGYQNLTPNDSETNINTVITYHKFSTTQLDYHEMLEIREFLMSANDGQDIILDIYGTIDEPDTPVNCKLKFMKKIKAGTPSYKKYDFSFELIEFS